ncbi:MAG: membrane-bound lytic murein transglycosylase MltF [Pseudomonadota bacterium]
MVDKPSDSKTDQPGAPRRCGASTCGLGVLALFVLPVIWWASMYLELPVDPGEPPRVFLWHPALPFSRETQMEDVLRHGTLRVATRISPTTYVPAEPEPYGLEHDLAVAFAESLGVRVEFVLFDDPGALFEAVRTGKAHLAAAGLAVSEDRERHFRFTPPYMEVTRQLLYRDATSRPETLAQLGNVNIETPSGASHEQWLREMSEEFPDIVVQSHTGRDGMEVLDLLEEGKVNYAIAYSNEVQVARQFNPTLKVAFDLGEPVQYAWVFPRSQDRSLYQRATVFFQQLRQSGRLDDLLDRYNNQFEEMDTLLSAQFIRDIRRNLHRYRKLFEAAGKRYSMDWRLLAAIGYQESKWQPEAVSPAGAVGLMQFTLPTARHMGISNPVDPEASIMGAAAYLAQLRSLLPDDIPEPDRTYMALASYNMGHGHLDDARKITEENGHNAKRWKDVRMHLPLLSEPRWHRKLRHGFAHGQHTARYVENIRAFHDMLVWLSERDNPRHADKAANGDALATYSSPLKAQPAAE